MSLANSTVAGEPTSFIPRDAVMALHVREPSVLLRSAWSFLDSLNGHDAVRASEQLRGLRLGLIAITGATGQDAIDAIGELLGDEVVLAITGLGPNPDVVIIAESEHPQQRDEVLESLLELLELFDGSRSPDDRRIEIGGLDVIAISEEAFLCRRGSHLIFTNSRAAMALAIEAESDVARSLAGEPRYRRAVGRVPADATAWLWVDADAIRSSSDNWVQPMLSDAGQGFLFAGWAHTLQDAPDLIAWVEYEDGEIRATLATDSPTPLPASHRGLRLEGARSVAFDAAALPGFAGEIRLTRDWSSMIAERESILTIEAANKLIDGTNGISAIMGQVDVVEDVLPHVVGPVRLLAFEREYNELPVSPTPKLPAIALVFQLDENVEKSMLGRRLYSASSAALSILSFQGANNGRPPLLLEPDIHRGRRMLATIFGLEPNEDELMGMDGQPLGGIAFNFLPGVAVVEDHLIIATTRELLTDLIDARIDAPKPLLGDPNVDRILVDAGAVARLLELNREEIIAQNMLEKNHTRAVAEGELGLLLDIIGRFDSAELQSHQTEHGHEATLVVRISEE